MSSTEATNPIESNPPATGARTWPAPWRFTSRGVALRLFITCWLIYTLHFATNTVREIYPAMSLGDHLSFDVSEYVGLHPDIFEVPGRGAFINNNPGASILGAIPYTLARPAIDRIVERVQSARAASQATAPEYNTIYPMAMDFYRKAYERGLDVKFGLAAGVMQAFLMAPLSALSAVAMFYILLSLTSSIRPALFLAMLYAFATPIFYRTGQLNQNVLISHFALFAFVLLWRPWDDPSSPRRPRYLVAGLLSGWAVVLDYSGLVVVLFLSLYALVRHLSLPTGIRSRFGLLRYAAGVLACIAVLMAYQWSAFGSPVFPAQHYMPPTIYSSYGFNGMGWPQLDLMWETAFGMRFGLFTSAPILLLALYVPGWFRDQTSTAPRETWFIIFLTIAFFLFSSANQYGRLQFNSGVRYIVPVTPFLFLLVARVLVRMPTVLAVFVGVFATYWSWSLAMYRDVEQGLGVFEALVQIPLGGVRLPWLTTLERMGYLPGGAAVTVVLTLAGVVVWGLWYLQVPAAVRRRLVNAQG